MGQEEKGVRYDSPEWSQKAHVCKVGGKQLGRESSMINEGVAEQIDITWGVRD